MGAMESSVGFYNDRKIIRYKDGTFEYPCLEVIPFGQKEERAKAFIRIQNSEELKHQYRKLPPSLGMDPAYFQKFLDENPEYAVDKKAQEASDYLERLVSASDKSSTVRSRRPRSGRINPDRNTSDNDSASLLSSSRASTMDFSNTDPWKTEKKNFIKQIRSNCSKHCGFFSWIREYRRNRVQNEDEACQRMCSVTEDKEVRQDGTTTYSGIEANENADTKSLLRPSVMESLL